MNATELRELEDRDLEKRINDLREELFNLRFQFATRQLTNHSRIREVRREIARVNTLLRERDLVPMEG